MPTSLLLELAPLARRVRPCPSLARAQVLGKRGQRAARARARERSARTGCGDRRRARRVRRGPRGRRRTASRSPSSTARAGRARRRARALRTARELAPNRAAVWAGLAEELGADREGGATPQAVGGARARARARARATRATARSSRCAAGVAQARRPAERPRRREVPRPVRSRSSRDARASRRAARPTSADRQLHWLRAVVMHPDRRVSQLIHYAREIVIAPRTEEELFEDIPAEGDLTEILRARVHRKDGGVAFPSRSRTRARGRASAGRSSSRATSSRSRSARGRRAPSAAAATRRSTSSTTRARPSTHPLLYNEVVVESPPAVARSTSTCSTASADRRGRRRTRTAATSTRLVWDKPPIVADEPLAPALTRDRADRSSARRSRPGTTSARGTRRPCRASPSPTTQVRALAAELTKGKTTRDEKLQRDLRLRRRRHPLRELRRAASGGCPNRPQQLLARREGDCDDKAMLLITLLKAVGIEAQEVMVQTR